MTETAQKSAREELADVATRYVFNWKGKTITIERYTNHGTYLRDGCWVVAHWLSPPGSDLTNVLYLGSDGTWRYKNGARWATLEDAWVSLQNAGPVVLS